MREGWRIVRLGDVCTIDKAKHNGAPLPYVGLEHIESDTGKYLGDLSLVEVKSATFRFSPNHVLYGRLRPYLNKVMLPEFDGHCSSEIFPLKPREALDRRFLYYWITQHSVVKEIDKTSTGARMPRANVNQVMGFELILPPVTEQRRIVAILDEAFGGIDTVVTNTKKNLENTRDMFDSYLNTVFDQRGEGWVDIRLGDVCERVSVGHVGSTTEFYCEPENGVPFLRSQNVRRGRIDWSGVRYITKEFHDELKKSQLRSGDLLFVRVGANRGDCSIVREELECLNCANIVFARPRDCNVEYFELYALSLSGRSQLLGMTTGSAQGVINTKSVAELIIPCPPADVQASIVDRCNDLVEEVCRVELLYQQKLSALAELKQSLLQKAFSGELTASKAEAAVEEATA